jgi:hypothetical protein
MMLATLQATHTAQWRYTRQVGVLRKCETMSKIANWSLRGDEAVAHLIVYSLDASPLQS